MKRLLLAFFALCGLASATPTFVQAKTCNAASSTCNITLGSGTTSGNTLVVFIESGGSTGTQTVCDGSGCPTSTDTFSSRVGFVGNSAGSGWGGTYDAFSIAGGTTNITVTVTSATGIGAAAIELSGASTHDVAVGTHTTSVSTAYASPSFSTAAATEIIIGCFGMLNTSTVSSPLIGGSTATLNANAESSNSNGSVFCEYLNVTSLQSSITANLTGTSRLYVSNAVSYSGSAITVASPGAIY